MFVSAIKAQVKQEGRVSVFVDGKYSFSLTLDQLLVSKLKKSSELDESDIQNYKKLSDEGKLKQRALEWLMGRPHSTRELREYLYRKKVEKDLAEAIVEEFTVKKYLNDEDYARWFADGRRRKNKSARAITAELYTKGISPLTIHNIVSELENVSDIKKSEKEALSELINKLRNRSRYQDQQKLVAYLMSKGFKYSDIKEAMET